MSLRKRSHPFAYCILALLWFPYWSFQSSTSFVDPFCHLCFLFVFVILYSICLFLEALWLSAGKWLTPWISCMGCFPVLLSLSHMVPLVRCGTWLYWLLIVDLFLTKFMCMPLFDCGQDIFLLLTLIGLWMLHCIYADNNNNNSGVFVVVVFTFL